VNFAIDVQLPQTPRDQLRYLGAEVDDEEAVVMCHGQLLTGLFENENPDSSF